MHVPEIFTETDMCAVGLCVLEMNPDGHVFAENIQINGHVCYKTVSTEKRHPVIYIQKHYKSNTHISRHEYTKTYYICSPKEIKN